MKDSRVNWFGEVPAHWEIKRQRNVAEMRVSNVDKHVVDGEVPIRLCNYVDVYKNDRITNRIQFMRATASKEEVERFRLQLGDVIITKDSEEWDDIGVPALVEYAAPDLICGYHLAILRPYKGIMNGAYLLRALQSKVVAYQYHVLANGVTRYGLSHDAIKSVVIPVPPFDEQSAIVRFLDYVDRRTRLYIRAKRRLIELLNEEMEVIIHKTVTRGLNPDVCFRPSGINWLKDVPEHWEVLRIKDLAQLKSGESITALSISETGPYPVYGGNGLRGFTTNYTHDGDFVLIGRQGALCGNINYAKGKFWASEHAVVARPRRDFMVVWFGELLRTMNLNQYSISAAQPGLAVERIQNLRLPVPPVDEQALIARHIEDETAGLRRAVATAHREIDLLGEYRASLISDVVTGKLEVRGIELPQADDPEEVEPLGSSIDEPPEEEESLDANE